MTRSRIHRIAIALLFCLSVPCIAQGTEGPVQTVRKAEEKAEPEKSCTDRSVEAVTDRPTVATSTETTPCGVIELLVGPERFWTGHTIHQDDLAEALQFGVTHSADIHYAGYGFFSTGSNRSGTLSGVSDTNLGVRYRFKKQRRHTPSAGVYYNVKIPTASVANGLSTGRFDHQAGLLVSQDIPRLHLDFNAIPQFIGRPVTSGFDRNTALFLFASTRFHRKLTLVAGSYGLTRLNADTPAYATATAGFAWKIHPRLILDAGWDEGLTSFAPRKRIGFGLTYAPVNLYSVFAHSSEIAPKNSASHD